MISCEKKIRLGKFLCAVWRNGLGNTSTTSSNSAGMLKGCSCLRGRLKYDDEFRCWSCASQKKTAEEYPVPELNYQSLESFVILETQQELGGR